MVVASFLNVDLNGLKLKSPIITASGTYGYADEYGGHGSPGCDGCVVHCIQWHRFVFLWNPDQLYPGCGLWLFGCRPGHPVYAQTGGR